MERMLGALGTIATILGIVTQYLDYRMRRDAARRTAEQPSGVGSRPPSRARQEKRGPLRIRRERTEPMRSPLRAPDSVPSGEGMPKAVRVLFAMLLVTCALSLLIAYLFAIVLLRNVDNFGYDTDALPRGVPATAAAVFTLLIAAFVVPGTVRRWYSLRHRDEMIRVKLVSAGVANLFVGVALAATTLLIDDVTDVKVPDDVVQMVAVFLGYVILSDLGYLILLAMPSDREWITGRSPH